MFELIMAFAGLLVTSWLVIVWQHKQHSALKQDIKQLEQQKRERDELLVRVKERQHIEDDVVQMPPHAIDGALEDYYRD